MPAIRLVRGDALSVLSTLPSDSVDSIVTDPPYGLSKEPDIATVLKHWLDGDDYAHRGGGFMGKSWDSFVPGPSVWKECLRVLKPGGHLLCFAGTRTVDLMGISIRLGGFEIRDEIVWLYGTGFPKSLNVSKAIDKAAGVEREVVGSKLHLPGYYLSGHDGGEAFGHGLSSSTPETRLSSSQITAPATPEAEQWEGWGTALKPAHEPIIVARKPIQGTVANNVLAHGTGALNIDATRIGYQDDADKGSATPQGKVTAKSGALAGGTQNENERAEFERPEQKGRFPANVMLSHSPECEQVGTKKIKGVTGGFREGSTGTMGAREGRYGAAVGEATRDRTAAGTVDADGNETVEAWTCTEGCAVAMLDAQSGASRFFYTTKASKSERNKGLPEGTVNRHPTIKPVALMAYLVRLVTPPGGTVLDPYVGSGTTMVAATTEGFDGIGIDRDDDREYLDVAAARIAHAGGSVSGPADE